MEQYIIKGGNPLVGEVEIGGAKNAALGILAAAIMADEPVLIENLPDVNDINVMLEAIEGIGAMVQRIDRHTVKINGNTIGDFSIDYDYIKKIRASYYLLGALLGKYKRAEVPLPGGCNIGSRPIDQHLKGFETLGASIEESGGKLYCQGRHLRGGQIVLAIPSVGATENIMLAAVKAEGKTVIRNAAKEPEIVDLQNFLSQMGADVSGAGGDTVEITGVKRLHGVDYTPMKDRIEAGTFLIAAASCGGEIETEGVSEENIAALLHKLRENGCKITAKGDKIRLRSSGDLKAASLVETLPFPGFPTDMQAQYAALSATARGTAVIVENLFETRYKYAGELKKMGADVTVRGRTAVIRGVEKLHGAEVSACDLRGGAALVIAALKAEGESVVSELWHIDRGYALFDEKLKALGAGIVRTDL